MIQEPGSSIECFIAPVQLQFIDSEDPPAPLWQVLASVGVLHRI